MRESSGGLIVSLVSLFVLLSPEISPVYAQDNKSGLDLPGGAAAEGQDAASGAERPGGFAGFSYDSEGRIAKSQDQFGVTTSFVNGLISSVVQPTKFGDFTKRYFHTTSGWLLMEAVQVEAAPLGRALRKLQLDDVAIQEAGDPATAETLRRADGSEIQITKVFGIEGRITRVPLGAGEAEITDSWGGRRVELRAEGSLLEAYDDVGPLLRISYDSLGRPSEVEVGGGTILRYVYEGTGRNWREKKLVAKHTNRVIGSWMAIDSQSSLLDAPYPRPRVNAYSPSAGQIFEWDAYSYPSGAAVFQLGGSPHVYIPFGEESAVWRSINTELSCSACRDRIDYNGERVRLHLSLGSTPRHAAGSDISVVVDRPRLEFFEKTGDAQ